MQMFGQARAGGADGPGPWYRWVAAAYAHRGYAPRMP